MTMFVIQTIILLAIAFVIGCLIGYLLRMLFAPGNAGQTSAGSSDAPAQSLAQSSSATASQAGTAAKASAAKKPAKTTAKRKPTSKSKTTTAKAKAPAKTAAKANASNKSKTTAKPAAKATSKAAAKSTATTAAKSAKKPAAKTTAKTASKTTKTATAKTTKASASKTSKAATSRTTKTSASKTTARKATSTAKTQTDDLKRIRGIGPKLEARMNAIDITSYAQIAGWTIKQQREFGEKLAFPGRIERDEWVKQAKLLAKGKDTDFSSRVDKGQVASSTGKVAAAALGKKPPVLKKEPANGPDNLTLIDGVGNAIEKKLFALGIYKFSQIAKWTKDQQVWIGNEIGSPGRPERENWVTDAKTLAAGGTTAHSKKVESGAVKSSRKS